MLPLLSYAIVRALLAVAVGLPGAHPAAVTPARAVGHGVHPVRRRGATPARMAAGGDDRNCGVALAYLHAHGNPAFEMRCEPGDLPAGLAAVTCWHATGLGVSCLDGGIVVISQPSCPITYENEASNSWLDFSTLTPGAVDGRDRRDASGRAVDPFGECP